ncbi:MAG: response regulator transcription factor [Fuerstiella sp.]
MNNLQPDTVADASVERPKQILLIDDHPVTRQGLALQIRFEPNLEVCGEAADADAAMELVSELLPDLAVVDVSLSAGNGIELVKRMKIEHPQIRCLVYSMYEESLYADRALRAGAAGYVNKTTPPDEVIRAIHRVLSGHVYVSPQLSEVMLTRMVRGQKAVSSNPAQLLSDRELESFQMMGRGMTTRQIAEALQLSPKTIETYRARIKVKLNVDSMAELTRLAAQWVLENG